MIFFLQKGAKINICQKDNVIAYMHSWSIHLFQCQNCKAGFFSSIR